MAGISIPNPRSYSEIVQVIDDLNLAKDIQNNYKCLRVKDIDQEIDFSTVFVKGQVVSENQKWQAKSGWTMKVVIKDDDSDPCNTKDACTSISIFMRGGYVETCLIKNGDTLIVSGIQLERSTVGLHPFNIIADERNKNLKIWINRNTENTVCKLRDKRVISEPADHVSSSTHDESTCCKKRTFLQQSTVSSGTSDGLNSIHDSEKRPHEPATKRAKLLNVQPKAEAYTKLSDLRVNTTINVYGVVKFFKSPFKTKGLDFLSTLSLVDPSLDSLEESFKCILFSKSRESLPLVKSVGDIVRFHHLGVGRFKGELQGKFFPGSSWLVFDRDHQATPWPRSSSSKSFTLTDLDNDLIGELRSWAAEKDSLCPSTTITNLKDLSTSQSFVNLFCQVVSKCFMPVGNCVVLSIWDGTLPACQSIHVEPISEQGKITSEELIHQAAGRSVDVFLYDNHAEGDIRRVCPGDFVRIINVHMKAVDRGVDSTDKLAKPGPRVALVVHKGTICGRGLEILSASDPVVTSSATFQYISEAKEPLKTWQEQAHAAETDEFTVPDVCDSVVKTGDQKEDSASSSKSRALQTSCTVAEHPYIPFTSVKSIKASDSVPSKFRCRVKAVMYLPHEMKQFVQQCCQSCRNVVSTTVSSSTVSRDDAKLCPNCSQETSDVYLFSLVLEDKSGLIQAMVFDCDAETFFPELPPPREFAGQPSVQETLHQWLLSMTQNPENSLDFLGHDFRCDNRPWMELCILSYFSKGTETDRRVLYRVFDSVFVTCP